MLTYPPYIKQFLTSFPDLEKMLPWNVVAQLQQILQQRIKELSTDYTINRDVAIHKTAKIEENVTLKGPIIVGAESFIGSHAYLRGGVYAGEKTVVGPGCEVKTSVIMHGSSLAHFNFVGDSILGSFVNMEAGSIIANHFNERLDKTIHIMLNKKKTAVDVTKFGALVGDHSKIGANAVLSPGTILSPQSVVKRLELVEQCS